MKKTLKKLFSLTLALLMIFSMGIVSSAASVAKVTSLQAYNIDDDEINLKWKAVSGADGYRVYIYNNSKWKSIGSTTKTKFEADDLASGKQYKFKVRAYELNGSKRTYGKYSSVLTAATEPDEVENVRASSKKKTTVTLKWNTVKNARGYQVYMYDASAKKYVRKAVVSKNTATIKNLKAGTTYTFRVRAYIKSDSKYYYGDFSDSFKVKTNGASSSGSSASSSGSLIGATKAGNIALNHAGLKKSQVYEYECELDTDNGVKVYEVSFEYGRYDYDYEINAKTGKIIHWEKERD